jgi:sugar phosphate permease
MKHNIARILMTVNVMLIGLQALDYVPKKAAGTAAGLTGLFGYLFGADSGY